MPKLLLMVFPAILKLRHLPLLITTVFLLACSATPPTTWTPEPDSPPEPSTISRPILGSIDMDREALVALFDALDGENWRKKINWLSDRPIGEWYGVTTDAKGRVIELEFGEWTRQYALGDNAVYYDDHTGESYVTNELRGKLPPEIGQLFELRRLMLDGESLFGEIPPELGNLLSLEYLNLKNNGLAGTIPVELGSLRNLAELNLAANRLTGEIPAEMGNLARLKYLRLSHNALRGEVPRELIGLEALVVLELHRTRLVGCVPEELRVRLNTRYSNIGSLRFC